MKCAACHKKMVQKKGEIDLRIEGKLYIARNVSYEECQSCGEKVFTHQVSQDLYEKVRKGEFAEETIKVPVLDGTYG